MKPRVLAWLLAVSPFAIAQNPPGRGIPESLAAARATHIHSLRYELRFRIPESKSEPVRGVVTVRFELLAPRQVVLDFEQRRDHVQSIQAGGRPVRFAFVDGHII